jgi:hypothetical protein
LATLEGEKVGISTSVFEHLFVSRGLEGAYTALDLKETDEQLNTVKKNDMKYDLQMG